MHMTRSDIGANLAAKYAVAGTDVTAGGSGDGTEVDGAWIDMQDFGSSKIVIAYTATLADGETLSIAANAQDATDSSGTGAADFGTAYSSTVVATGDTGGSTETGVVELDLDVTEANRYVRVQFTPTMSAATTDTAELAAVYVVGGADRNPVTNSVI